MLSYDDATMNDELITRPRDLTPKETLSATAHTVQRWAGEVREKYARLPEAGRSVAIAVTSLETAALWLKRASEEAGCDGDPSVPSSVRDTRGSQ
jgi:hypothetical protein